MPFWGKQLLNSELSAPLKTLYITIHKIIIKNIITPTKKFLKILLPVFLGGYITYKASEKAKLNETKQDNIKKFVLLSQITNFCFNDIYVYKDQVLKPIRKKINDNDFENNLTSLYIPLNEFNIDIEKYIFIHTIIDYENVLCEWLVKVYFSSNIFWIVSSQNLFIDFIISFFSW